MRKERIVELIRAMDDLADECTGEGFDYAFRRQRLIDESKYLFSPVEFWTLVFEGLDNIGLGNLVRELSRTADNLEELLEKDGQVIPFDEKNRKREGGKMKT